jgi:excisionase family DNA binding protein
VAAFLQIGRAAAYQAVHRGDIPSLRIGRTIRVPRFRIEELLLGRGAGDVADR